MARVTYNKIALQKAIAAQADRVIRPRVEPLIVKRFEEDKQQLLASFDRNKITKELRQEGDAESSVISTSNGGNLFSFLGFNAGTGDDVVRDLRDILESETKQIGNVKTVKRGKSIIYEMTVKVPTIDAIISKTQGWLSWTTRSFVEIIEKGHENFKRYLFDDSGRLANKSRSLVAIQVKKRELRGSGFSGVSYISKILQKFLNSLRNRK